MDDLLHANSTCRTGNVNQYAGQNVSQTQTHYANSNDSTLNTVTGIASITSVSSNSDVVNLSLPDIADADAAKIQHAWVQHGFIKPFRLLHQFSGSGFGTLTYVYKILVTLPVTSCSAERAMSRIRIIKNRLRSTMLDDWLSALMCLASERDVMQQLSVDDIINKFAQCSEPMRRQLVYS